MFINEQCSESLSLGYFEAAIRAMDKYATQLWPHRLALDFIRAFGGH